MIPWRFVCFLIFSCFLAFVLGLSLPWAVVGFFLGGVGCGVILYIVGYEAINADLRDNEKQKRTRKRGDPTNRGH